MFATVKIGCYVSVFVLFSVGGDDRSDITSVYRKPISDTASEAPSELTVISAANSMKTPPLSEYGRTSDIWSAINMPNPMP